MPNLMVVVASTRQARIGSIVADWVIAAANERTDLTVDIADLRRSACRSSTRRTRP